PEARLATVHKRPAGARLDQIRPGRAETRLAAAERELRKTRTRTAEPRLAAVPTPPTEPGLDRRAARPGLARRSDEPGRGRRPAQPGPARRRAQTGLDRRPARPGLARRRPGVRQIGAGCAEARLAAIGAEPGRRAKAGPAGRVRRRQPARTAWPEGVPRRRRRAAVPGRLRRTPRQPDVDDPVGLTVPVAAVLDGARSVRVAGRWVRKRRGRLTGPARVTSHPGALPPQPGSATNAE